jgi:hypothetical protein
MLEGNMVKVGKKTPKKEKGQRSAAKKLCLWYNVGYRKVRNQMKNRNPS